jgi:hypothetical protein
LDISIDIKKYQKLKISLSQSFLYKNVGLKMTSRAFFVAVAMTKQNVLQHQLLDISIYIKKYQKF